MKILKILLIAPILLMLNSNVKACGAKPDALVKIVNDMCFMCSFPLTVGGVSIITGPMSDPNPSKGNIICICPFPPPIFQRIGVPVSFFEPSRMIDIVSEPYCFPSLGFSLGSNNKGTLGGQKNTQGNSSKHTFMQSHYTIFPVYSILEFLVDFSCVISTGTDVGYITEIDPMWNSDTLGAYLSPEALLFGNPITNLACVADSATASSGHPLDLLFWCLGGWGNAYPLTGHKPSSNSYIQDSAAIAAKLLYKLHRELILWSNSGVAGLCHPYPEPIWRKTEYRIQPILPIALNTAMVIGRAGALWTTLKDYPNSYNNFAYLIFKKLDCCAF